MEDREQSRAIRVRRGRSNPAIIVMLIGAEPTLAVIVVHGTNRNADDYFETMVQAAVDAGALTGTVVVSPRFQTEDDRPAADEARWTSGGWKRGNRLQGAYRFQRALRLSSFMDSLFPDNHHQLVVVPGVGHSSLQMFTSDPGLGAIFLP